METVCDVCRLLDGDYSVKFCQWCRGCQAWLCEHDLASPFRRLQAAFAQRMHNRQGEMIG